MRDVNRGFGVACWEMEREAQAEPSGKEAKHASREERREEPVLLNKPLQCPTVEVMRWHVMVTPTANRSISVTPVGVVTATSLLHLSQ